MLYIVVIICKLIYNLKYNNIIILKKGDIDEHNNRSK